MAEKGTTVKFKNETIHSMAGDGEIRLLTEGRYMDGNVDIAVNRNLDDEDEGKVVSGGALVAQTSITVTENDTYDTTTNDEVVVEVENSYSASDEGKVVDGGELVAQGRQTVTENGTYDTTLISELTANIAGGGGGAKNILKGASVPTALDGVDGDIYLQTGLPLSQFTDVHQNSMSLISKDDHGIEYDYISGGSIGAYAYFSIDLTDIDEISYSISSGAGSYNNYATPRFAPFICIKQSTGYPVDADATAGIGAETRISTANTTKKGTIDVSSYTGDYYIIFNASGCDCRLNYLGGSGSDLIAATYCKVNGAWQALEGTDVDDVNTDGGEVSVKDIVIILNKGIINSIVPFYTSATNPTGYTLSYSSQGGSSTPAWAIFNKTIDPVTSASTSNVIWTTSQSAPQWVQIQLPEAKKINSFYISTYLQSGTNTCKTYKIQGSNDGATFTDIFTETLEDEAIGKYVALPQESDAYSYYRIVVTESYHNTYIGLTSFFPMFIDA